MVIEMDMANLQQVVDQDMYDNCDSYSFSKRNPASCCEFIIQLTPDYKRCNLRVARADYYTFYGVMETCKTVDAWDRMLGGKMNDKYGWYLPFIYIDGYIDIKKYYTDLTQYQMPWRNSL